ncbi:arsenate reductase (glutaredoxin) [Paracoccus aerodenitrificans]|uniref:arsenate reductase (glutaredoxin) n=1 Tax=Paracoccus aerodenitrificans TaxID=3017781 RepID=UPI0022F062A9|nr:arsenate reductase (glutaredoxin) [Paracoccus aerodenitrificans]WBU62943.1 arsenate reductase (glutaredoxin) [Paracoccus aerodenitrificans]
MIPTIYHNPKCVTSRKVLEAIRSRGLEPEIILYLKTPPSAATLRSLADDSGLGVRGLLRKKGTPYAELGMDDENLTDDQLLAAIAEHPVLLNRPIVVTGKGTRLVRPIEVLDEIL